MMNLTPADLSEGLSTYTDANIQYMVAYVFDGELF